MKKKLNKTANKLEKKTRTHRNAWLIENTIILIVCTIWAHQKDERETIDGTKKNCVFGFVWRWQRFSLQFFSSSTFCLVGGRRGFIRLGVSQHKPRMSYLCKWRVGLPMCLFYFVHIFFWMLRSIVWLIVFFCTANCNVLRYR